MDQPNILKFTSSSVTSKISQILMK